MPILHVPLDERLHVGGTNRKGKRSWERYIHELIARDIEAATLDAPVAQTDVAPAQMPPVVLVSPPATDEPIRVAAPCAAVRVEPATILDRWKTADELLRDDGHPSCQHGVLIGASANICGQATVTIKGE